LRRKMGDKAGEVRVLKGRTCEPQAE
jgi:hypothetical protein